MADNLTQVEQNIDTAIDPNAGIGGIKAQDHNDVLKEVLKKAGKYTGLAFIGKKETNAGAVSIGSFIWNANAMNNTNAFTVTTSKQTADLNDFGVILSKLNAGDIIKFKDFSGRSVFLEFVSFTADTDTNNADIYNVEVKGFAENTNYSYNNTDNEICFLDFFVCGVGNNSTDQKITIDGVDYKYKNNSANGTVTAPNTNDIAEYGVRTITEDGNPIQILTSLVYISGTPSDFSSWLPILEVEV